jgi:hypothetical protein
LEVGEGNDTAGRKRPSSEPLSRRQRRRRQPEAASKRGAEARHNVIDESGLQLEGALHTFELLSKNGFESDCKEAFSLFNQMRNDVLLETYSSIEHSIKKAVTPHVHSRWRRTIDFIFFESFKHLIILCMALFFWALGILYVIDKIIPPMRASLVHFVQEEEKWFSRPEQ